MEKIKSSQTIKDRNKFGCRSEATQFLPCRTTRFLFFIAIVGIILLKNGNAQSVLSLHYPLGIPTEITTGPALGMAGTGVAVSGDFLSFISNPGNLGAMDRTTFSGAFAINFLTIDDNSRTTSHAFFQPKLLSLAIPIKKFGTFGFGVKMETSTDFTYRIGEKTNMLQDIDSVYLDYTRKGGLTKWEAGWGYEIGTWVRGGITYERVYFTDAIAKFRSTVGKIVTARLDSTKITFSGNGLRLGLQVPIKNLTIGLSGEYVFPDSAKKITIEDKDLQAGSGPEDTTTTRFYLQFPPRIAAGISYSISSQWLVAADFDVTLWNRYSSDANLGIDSQSTAIGFSVGSQFIPAPTILAPHYWEIIRYRGGVRYTQMPITTGNEFGITVGIGLPIQENKGLVDIAFEYGRRYDSRYENYKEHFYKVQFGLNGASKWFQPSDIRY